MFPIALWNVNERVLNEDDRTNNFSEANNRKLNTVFSVDHPTVFKFIDGLRKMQVGRDAEVERMIRNEQPTPKRRKYVRADDRIIDLLARFEHDDNIIALLRGIAHNSVMEQ